MARRLAARVLILSLLFLLVGCDHASKGVAKAELEGESAHELIRGLLSFRYVENTDIAFNLLRWVPEEIRFPALLVSGALAVIGLCALLLQARGRFNVPVVALILVTAGAVGNYLDRVFRGYVVDFVHVRHWPVFNVADIYITIGLVVIAWGYAFNRAREPSADG
jgi:signal peptidase II